MKNENNLVATHGMINYLWHIMKAATEICSLLSTTQPALHTPDCSIKLTFYRGVDAKVLGDGK